jgi:hypothetical protein
VGLREELVTLEEIFFEGGEVGLEGFDKLEDGLGGSLGWDVLFKLGREEEEQTRGGLGGCQGVGRRSWREPDQELGRREVGGVRREKVFFEGGEVGLEGVDELGDGLGGSLGWKVLIKLGRNKGGRQMEGRGKREDGSTYHEIGLLERKALFLSKTHGRLISCVRVQPNEFH